MSLLEHADDPLFQKKWAAVKQTNKERLAHYVETTLSVKINTKAMFDVHVKRLHEYKVRRGCRTATGAVWLRAASNLEYLRRYSREYTTEILYRTGVLTWLYSDTSLSNS